MSEWWTYSLSDFLLFSPRTYYRLFELYNAAIWPTQVVALALGAVLLVLLVRHAPWRGWCAAAILAGCWLWVGWFYHSQHYVTINWAAAYFAYGFAIEALLLSWTGGIRDRLRFRGLADRAGAYGFGLTAFALVIYPLIGPLGLGRPWTQVEIFGVVPDPTVLATLGVLAAAERPHWHLMVLPMMWCVISGATLWTMESPEAPITPVAAAIALALTAWKSLARAA
jgi:uncharacterized protein DUF6064